MARRSRTSAETFQELANLLRRRKLALEFPGPTSDDGGSRGRVFIYHLTGGNPGESRGRFANFRLDRGYAKARNLRLSYDEQRQHGIEHGVVGTVDDQAGALGVSEHVVETGN